MSVRQPRALVARDQEISIFQAAEASNRSEFLAVYGRRRIGKTFLIDEYFKKNRPFYFYFTGEQKTPVKIQLASFHDELKRKFNYQGKEKFANWREALSAFTDIINNFPVTLEKKVIFFDELPYLASKKSGFKEALGYFWNTHLARRSDVILVVCGSAASWMVKHIVHNKGSLHNRLTKPAISLAPFTLNETQRYLKALGADLDQEQIAEIYMVTGGVAFYLDQYELGESANSFVNRVFFNGPLRTEFNYLFSSLFDDYKGYVETVTALGNNRYGLSRDEIGKKIKQASGSGLTKILEELEQSSFIRGLPKLGRKKQVGTYILTDEYSLFYLTWIAPLGMTITEQDYWQKQANSSSYHSWHGHAFESLCLKHSIALKEKLGIASLTTYEYGFKTDSAQVDLVIDRADKTANLCEMKYTAEPYEMTAAEAMKLDNRKKELAREILLKTKKKKQIFVTLVTPQPAVKNSHYNSIVQKEINLSALFV